MALLWPTQYETRWRALLASFDKKYETLTADNSDATKEMDLVRTALVKIGQLIQSLSSGTAIALPGSN